jgi:hypothetical protein
MMAVLLALILILGVLNVHRAAAERDRTELSK